MCLASLPFAFTEFMFYPSYWEPKFLWDLGNRIGFGIEDILFVTGFASFSTTAYLFFTNKVMKPSISPISKNPSVVLIGLVSLCFLGVGIFYFCKIPMIYGAPVIMFVLSFILSVLRKDLAFPGIAGGFFTTLVYSLLCLVLEILYPRIFSLAWHSNRFTGIYLGFIPLEEIMYAYSSGQIATIVYPFSFGYSLISKVDLRK